MLHQQANENNAKETRLTTDEHCQPLTWLGWNDLSIWSGNAKSLGRLIDGEEEDD